MAKITLIFVAKLAKTDVLAAFCASIRVILSHFSFTTCPVQRSHCI